MSLPSSPNVPAPIVQKPGTNVYTVMLILAFLSLVTGSVILSMELASFGPVPWKTGGAPAATATAS